MGICMSKKQEDVDYCQHQEVYYQIPVYTSNRTLDIIDENIISEYRLSSIQSMTSSYSDRHSSGLPSNIANQTHNRIAVQPLTKRLQ